jgi:hypothetical protein
MLARGLRLALPLAALLSASCLGNIGGDGVVTDATIPPEVANEVGVSGARRLTAVEYGTTVFDLVGVVPAGADLVLPTDDRTPFDNDHTKQIASQALIDGAELLAGEIAGQVVADPALRAAIVPCVPAGPDDAACFRSFVETFGRRALRRPVTPDEVTRFADHFLPHAAQANDFWVAVDSALRAFLQHPHFLYRAEIGEPVVGSPGIHRLGDFEIASRLSYLLWGSAPPDWLLDQAATGQLSDPTRLREAAETLLADPHALRRIARFHAMWLAYEQLPHAPELASAMNKETDALLGRYLLDERRPWSDLLLAEETYLTPDLATHYGLPPLDGEEGWVPYGDSGRRGLLSQGTFLSAESKFEDTSPTQRGLLIRTRLFCQVINPPPPDLGVNTDEPPGAADPSACKVDRYTMWKQDGCKTCHSLMDPVGFGLEHFDSAGRYRDHEPDRPECTIDGQGSLEGLGDFTGPAELGQLMIQGGEVDACVATMIYRFAMGRWKLDDHDSALLERLVTEAQGGSSLRFDAIISEFVGSEAFRLRREEVVSE